MGYGPYDGRSIPADGVDPKTLWTNAGSASHGKGENGGFRAGDDNAGGMYVEAVFKRGDED